MQQRVIIQISFIDMEKKYCTDIAQGQRLIACGLDPDSADLFITPKIGGYVISSEKQVNSKPSWCLVSLMNQMPPSVRKSFKEKIENTGRRWIDLAVDMLCESMEKQNRGGGVSYERGSKDEAQEARPRKIHAPS